MVVSGFPETLKLEPRGERVDAIGLEAGGVPDGVGVPPVKLRPPDDKRGGAARGERAAKAGLEDGAPVSLWELLKPEVLLETTGAGWMGGISGATE